MNTQPNPRIVGAALLGFALVAGAYVLANFAKPNTPTPKQIAVTNVAAVRTPIEVVDADNNGIEDWRDEFITTDPLVISDEEATTYTEPDTLTGQLGVNFMQDVLYARGYGALGRSDEEVIGDTIDILSQETAHELYDTPDITILTDWSDTDTVNYANSLALAIKNNDVPNMEGELFILYDMLQSADESRISELETLSKVFEGTRDDILALAVPAFAVKAHLDLVNTLHAVHKDIEAMTKAQQDPAFALLRIKRYEDDALGLAYALQNMYLVLEPHASLFTSDDPALLFVLFSPTNLTIQ